MKRGRHRRTKYDPEFTRLLDQIVTATGLPLLFFIVWLCIMIDWNPFSALR